MRADRINRARGAYSNQLANGRPVYSGYTDATSGYRIPQSAADYTSLISAYSLAVTAPDALHTCQQTSGNLTDAIGTKHLVPTNSPGYNASVTGWSLKAATLTDGTAHYWSVGGYGNTNATNHFVIMFCNIPTYPGGNRTIMFFGANVLSEPNAGSPRHRLTTGATNVLGTNFPMATVRPIGLMLRTGVSASLITPQEVITPAFTSVPGTTLFIGGAASAAPPAQIIGVHVWTGANAPTSTAAVKDLYAAYGWESAW